MLLMGCAAMMEFTASTLSGTSLSSSDALAALTNAKVRFASLTVNETPSKRTSSS